MTMYANVFGNEDGDHLVQNVRRVRGDKFANGVMAIALGNAILTAGHRMIHELKRLGLPGDDQEAAAVLSRDINTLMNLCLLLGDLQEHHEEVFAQAKTLYKILESPE